MGCAVTARGFSRCSRRKSCATSCRGPLVGLSPDPGMQRGQEGAEQGTERGRHPAVPRGAGAAHVLRPELLCQGKRPVTHPRVMERGGVQGHPPVGCHSTSGFDQRPAVTARLVPSCWSLLKNACGVIRLLGEVLPGKEPGPEAAGPKCHPARGWHAAGDGAAAWHWWHKAGAGDMSRRTQRRVFGQTDTSSTSSSSQSPPSSTPGHPSHPSPAHGS